MSSKGNKKDFLNKKRKQISDEEENSEQNNSENLSLNDDEKLTNKNASGKLTSKNSGKPEKYNEDILVGKDEVTLIVNNIYINFFKN